MSRVAWIAVIAVLLMLSGASPAYAQRAVLRPGSSPIVITPLSPLPGSTVYTETPNISASFSDSSGIIQPSDVDMVVADSGGSTDAILTGDAVVTLNAIYYDVPSILKLSPGNQTVTVTITVGSGAPTVFSWGFNVSTAAPPPAASFSINGSAVLVDIALGTAIACTVFSVGYAYARTQRRFTFHKYFATHPIQKEYLTLYVPCVAAFFTVLAGLSYVVSQPKLPWFAYDLVILIGLAVALTTYGIDSRRERTRIHLYESAFSQFLFEMADALRGGIDPTKALIEIAKTETDILAKPLRIAADGLKIGRSFDEVLRAMVVGLKSPLISRYAALIADGATVGGETSTVIYRAARDMDDFIKIERERDQQLSLPVGVIYISYGVLVACLFALLNVAPFLSGFNLGLLNTHFSASGGPSASPVAQVPPLDFGTLRERFLELSMMIGLGNGALIGAFTDGKPKYGIPHALVMAAGVLAVFIFFYP